MDDYGLIAAWQENVVAYYYKVIVVDFVDVDDVAVQLVWHMEAIVALLGVPCCWVDCYVGPHAKWEALEAADAADLKVLHLSVGVVLVYDCSIVVVDDVAALQAEAVVVPLAAKREAVVSVDPTICH